MKTPNEKIPVEKQDSNLHLAVLAQDIEKVDKYCKKIKAEDINLIDELNEKGLSPMHIAIDNKNEELINLLLENGANPNKATATGESPIILAIKNKLPKILVRLIEESANVNQSDLSGNSPLKIATDLGDKESIDILTEHGAFLAKSRPISAKTLNLTHKTQEYLDGLLLIVTEYVSANKKLLVFSDFYKQITTATQDYTDSKSLLFTKKIKNLEERLNNIFNQLVKVISDNSITVSKREILNIIRKVTVALNECSKEQLLQEEDAESIYLISKAESAIEEEIVKLKTADLIILESKANKTLPNIKVKIKKEDNTNNHKNNETSSPTKQSNQNTNSTNNFRLLETKKEKIITRKNNHDVELIDFITIRPYHPRAIEEVEKLLLLSLQRLKHEEKLFKYSPQEKNSHIDEIKNIINTATTQQRDLSSSEGILIDKILRPGKGERIHIIHFPLNSFEEALEDLYAEALETGATVHSFNYQENVLHKNDLTYAGIAAVNKLLDDGLHPDKIIIQGYESSANIAREVHAQFAKRSVNLTRMNYISSNLENINHRYICLASQNKMELNAPDEFKQFLDYITEKFSQIEFKENAKLSTLFAEKQLSLFQIINMFIKANQKFLSSSSKYKNPSMPQERVENIVGIAENSN